MGKGRNRRRSKRRQRREDQRPLDARSRQDRALTTPSAPVSWARIAARFGLLRGRGGVRIAFVTLGPIVQARDPDELAAWVLGGSDSWLS